MAIDASESGIPLKRSWYFFIGKVIAIFIDILLAITKIYDEYFILLLTQTHDKVSRVDIIVDKSFGVDPLNTI